MASSLGALLGLPKLQTDPIAGSYRVVSLTLLCNTDPFAEADEDTGETKQSQNYIHIRIQRKINLELTVLSGATEPLV